MDHDVRWKCFRLLLCPFAWTVSWELHSHRMNSIADEFFFVDEIRIPDQRRVSKCACTKWRKVGSIGTSFDNFTLRCPPITQQRSVLKLSYSSPESYRSQKQTKNATRNFLHTGGVFYLVPATNSENWNRGFLAVAVKRVSWEPYPTHDRPSMTKRWSSASSQCQKLGRSKEERRKTWQT